MGEMTVIQMMFRQRDSELAAQRQSEKSDSLSTLLTWCLILPLVVVFALLYAITLLAKAFLFPFRMFLKG